MKTTSKIVFWLVCGVLLAGAIITVAARQNTASQLRAEHEELVKTGDEMARLKAENAQLESLRNENEEVQKLRLANKDLPKLRNDVRQLRRQVEEAEKLRSENERLKTAGAAMAADANPQRLLANTFTKESLRDVGFAAPRATLETFFFALSRGDVNRMLDCVTPDAAAKLRAQPEDQLRRSFSDLGVALLGYEVEDRSQPSPGEIDLNIRLNAIDQTRSMRFIQIQNEWKMAP